MWCYPLLQLPSGSVLNLFICVLNTQTYTSAEMLGTIRVATQAITCTLSLERVSRRFSCGRRRAPISPLWIFVTGSLEGLVYAEKFRSAARWQWPIIDACNITSDTFLLVTANWYTVCIRVWIIFVDTLNSFCEYKLLLSFCPIVPELWDPLNYK